MRTRIVIAIVVVAVSMVVIAATRSANKEVSPETKTLTVEKLAAKPLEHLGRVKVEGVVDSVDRGKSMFVLISPKEFKECGTGCTDESTARVPVRVSLPSVKDKVIVEGMIKKEGSRAVFIAETVKKL